MGNFLRLENDMAEFGAEPGGIHVVVAAVGNDAEDAEHGTADEDKHEQQLAHAAEALRVGQVVLQVVEGEKPDVLLAAEEKETEEY